MTVRMRKKSKLLIGLSALMITMTSTSAIADTPHTWHVVNSNKGNWDARLQMISEGGHFVAHDGSLLSEFTVNPLKSQEYGFVLDASDDFNVAYTLTLTQKDPQQFSLKACVFVITATGPGKPDIRVASYNGAECTWKDVPGRGKDFFVA